MANLRNWTLGNYTNATWTTLARAPAVIRSLIIANTGGAAVTVEARIANGESEGRAVIIPGLSVDAADCQVVDLCQLNLGRADALQFKCSAAGVNITASGEEV